MRIHRISVNYGELRSTGYPSFSNTKHEVSLTASLEEGETPNNVLLKLEMLAKAEVKKLFGDTPEDQDADMFRPYHRPQ